MGDNVLNNAEMACLEVVRYSVWIQRQRLMEIPLPRGREVANGKSSKRMQHVSLHWLT